MKLRTLLFSLYASMTGRSVAANNSTQTTHGGGKITQRAEELIATRHLVVKPGASAGDVAICGENDEPLGLCPDEADVIDDPVAVHLFGATVGTRKAVASGTVGNNTRVFTADDGKVQTLPVGAGTYWEVGKTTPEGGGADGKEISIIPCYPIETVVS